MCHHNLKHVDWSFCATAHGKGPVVGVGGTVKRAVWRCILQKQVVNTAEDFAKVAKEACPNITIIYVSKVAIYKVRAEFEHLWTGSPRTFQTFVSLISSERCRRHRHSTELEKSALTPYFEKVRESTVFDSVHIFRPDVFEHSVDINVSLEEYFAVDYVNKFYFGRTVEKRENSH